MLRISKAQMAAFREEALRDFAERMTLQLRSVFAQHLEGGSGLDLNTKVLECVDFVAKHDIKTEYDVGRYLECAILNGWPFNAAPLTEWAREILEREDLSGAEKMDLIEQASA